MKQRINITAFLIIALTLVVAMAALFLLKLNGVDIKFSKKPQPSVDSVKLSTPEPVIDNTIKFDIEKVKVGESVGKMKIVNIRGYKTEEADPDNAFVDFKGQTQITGNIKYIAPGNFGMEQVCVQDLGSESEAKMPKLISQNYVKVYFCFDDLDYAKKLLVKNPDREDQGKVTVVIDDYKIRWFPIAITNEAKLISVVTP